jgi:hypothetical protein
MAYYCAANASSVWGTTTDFFLGTNTPTQHASTNTGVTSAGRLTATFTAPNIVNAVTGVHIYITNKASTGSPTTFTATLQEATVDTACTKTITLASVKTGWNFIKMPTPYVFTAVTAGRYRWKFTVDTGTVNIAADSGGTLGGYISWDDRGGTPVNGDFLFVSGFNDLTSVSLNMNGTRAVGGSSSYVSAPRSILSGVMISNGGTLDFDTTANSQLTVQGTVYVADGGQYSKGSVATPLSNSYTATTIYTMSATAQGGIYCEDGGKVILQGAPQTSTSLWKTKLVSGVGTAASPLVTADAVDWNVGDEILFSPTSGNATNYNETESRFIITKNSSTSYVLSTTSGGGEAAFTYAHSTDAWCVNVKRNIIEKGTSTTLMASFQFPAQSVTGKVELKWVRWENIDNSLFFGVVPVGYVYIGNNCNVDYSVCYYAPNSGFYFTGSTANTHTGLVTYSTGTPNIGVNIAATGGHIATTAQQKNFVDCFVMQHGANGFCGTGSYANTYTRCYAFSCHFGGTITALAGGFNMTGGSVTLTDCEAHCNRSYGITANSASSFIYNNLLCGTKGINQTTDIVCVSATAATILFSNCNFGSATRLSGYLNLLLGSELRFDRINDTDDNHYWFNPYGSAQATGSALSDTTVRTPGSLAVRLSPENLTTGFTWDFYIKAPANNIVAFTGQFRKNTAFGTSVARIELWLPGSASADATVTLSNDVEVWQAVSLSAVNTAAKPGLATIKVVALTSTASAYLYCDDFYNAGDTVLNSDTMTGLDTWVNGKPSPVISPSAVSAADIWTFPTTNLTTANTTGNQVKKLLTVAKFLGLK